MNGEEKVKYFIYCRKSSEAEDRQVQSIDTQVREMQEFAEKNNLEVIDIITESQSAHSLGREKFDGMIKRIQKGEANGLLVLFANRLSRNPVDSGIIIHLMDKVKILHVRTPSHIYINTSTEKMMLTLEFMISKKDSDDKSEFVKSGLRTRYIRGYPNGVAPIGFRNDLTKEKGNRGWTVEEQTFPIVRQILELFQTGKYSVRKLTHIANEEFGLRTQIHKKQGGKKLVLSYVASTLLKNPVYAGFFFAPNGTRHNLHESIPRAISEEQYWHIQKILNNKGRPRPSIHLNLFPYKITASCGGCNGNVTAEPKHQMICSECKNKFAYLKKTKCPFCGIAIEKMTDPTYLYFVYYHCTKKKHPECTERSIEEKDINKYLASYFKENLKISNELSEWCLQNLEQLDHSDGQDKLNQKTLLEKTLGKKLNEDNELNLMRARGLLNDEDLLQARGALKPEIEALQQEIARFRDITPEKLNKARKAFNLATGIEKVFENGSPEEKKEAILETGSNLTLKDKKVSVYHTNLYSEIIKGLLDAKTKNSRFEPESIFDTSERNEVFADVCPTLLPLLDKFRNANWSKIESEYRLMFAGVFTKANLLPV